MSESPNCPTGNCGGRDVITTEHVTTTHIAGDQDTLHTSAKDQYNKLPEASTDFGAKEYQRDADKPLSGHTAGRLPDQATGGNSVGSGGHDMGAAMGAPKYQPGAV